MTWGLGVAAAFVVLVLLLARRVRRGHARVERSPELRVTAPGLATTHDGSVAAVDPGIPMDASLVALRIGDPRGDYRTDARPTVDELILGEKDTVLADLARRTWTLELLALGAVLFLGALPLGTAIADAILAP